MIPGGPIFGVTKRIQKWPRYFANKALQRGAATDASSIEVRDTAYRTQAATKRMCGSMSLRKFWIFVSLSFFGAKQLK